MCTQTQGSRRTEGLFVLWQTTLFTVDLLCVSIVRAKLMRKSSHSRGIFVGVNDVQREVRRRLPKAKVPPKLSLLAGYGRCMDGVEGFVRGRWSEGGVTGCRCEVVFWVGEGDWRGGVSVAFGFSASRA